MAYFERMPKIQKNHQEIEIKNTSLDYGFLAIQYRTQIGQDHLESHTKDGLLHKSFPITYSSSTVHLQFMNTEECLVS